MSKRVHFTLQGKGGVGKSLVSALIAQYLIEHSKGQVTCIDTDPVNASFLAYKAFNAQRLDLMKEGSINERVFDELMETIFNATDGTEIVIDNGASSFIPLTNYLVENDAISVLEASGVQVVVHPVITGGQALLDTLTGFSQLAKFIGDKARMVVWLNEFFGEIKENGKEFEEMKAYKTHQSAIDGLIVIPIQNRATFGVDMEQMLKDKLTFEEAGESSIFNVMAKQRLSMTKKSLWQQMATVLGTIQQPKSN